MHLLWLPWENVNIHHHPNEEPHIGVREVSKKRRRVLHNLMSLPWVCPGLSLPLAPELAGNWPFIWPAHWLFPHCACSNVSSDCMHREDATSLWMQRHCGCNITVDAKSQWMQNHSGCKITVDAFKIDWKLSIWATGLIGPRPGPARGQKCHWQS